MWRLAAIVTLSWPGCGGPPGDWPGGPIDAAPVDGITWTRPDGAPVTDGAVSVDANQSNPLGVALVDVTDLVGFIDGGKRPDEGVGVGVGAAIGDVDGDGLLDMVLARCDAGSGGGPTLLLRQTGTGWDDFVSDPWFESFFAGRCAHGAALADFDADGDLDLFLAMSGSDILLENDAGTFTDVTTAAGVAGPADGKSAGAVWADLNTDGLLDLYVLSQLNTIQPVSSPANANRLYLNRAGGIFDEISTQAGVAGDGMSHAAVVADLNNDGRQDLYVANDRFAIDGESPIEGIDTDLLYRLDSVDGQGVPSFTDFGVAAGIDGPRSSMGVALTDINGDGFDDVYVTDYGRNHMQVWDTGSQTYSEQAAALAVEVGATPEQYALISWGARFVDFDRDGLVELVVVNGSTLVPTHCSHFVQLDRYLRQSSPGLPFVDITAEVGWPKLFPCPNPPPLPFAGRGLFIADLDRDGDDDLVLGAFAEPYRFYRNDTPQSDRHRLRIRPVGTVSAPDPAGAVLLVELVGGGVIRRTLYAGGDTNGQSDRVLEVGLGSDTGVASATLVWPSGYDQRLDLHPDFTIDEEWTVVEPAWLTLSERVVAPGDPAPTLTYRVVDEVGDPVGAGGAGLAVEVVRSDGIAVSVVDEGDGSYRAELGHPGSSRVTRLAITVAGLVQRPRPTVRFSD